MADRIDSIIDKMSIEQKAGQFLVLGFSGAFPHRDILESVDRYFPAGFRLTPHARKFTSYLDESHPASARVNRPPTPTERVYTVAQEEPRLTVAEMAETLNAVRRRTIEASGVACYFGHDQEGNYNADTLDHTMVAFPHYMGIACSQDPELARQIAYVTGRQLKAAGVDVVHGPVLDVNVEPSNPEIETRSFSPLVEEVIRFGVPMLKGFLESGCIPAAKHFPGRGASTSDAHYSVPVISESRERMQNIHLAPYRALIENGLPMIMAAHSVYPSLDASEEVSTISKAIMTDLLRSELSFDGVIVSDSFTMAGMIVRHEVAEGVIRSILAGMDLILMKDENELRAEVHAAVVEAIKSGRIPENRVYESLRRTLKLKERFGLLDGNQGIVDQKALAALSNNAENRRIAKAAAENSLVLLRDRDNLLPLTKEAKILVCEEPFGLMTEQNNSVAYCGALYHALLRHGYDALYADFNANNLDRSWPLIEQRAALVNIIVLTGYAKRGRPCNRAAYERFLQLGKPVVFVGNSPYEKLVAPAMNTVLVTFHTAAVSSQAAADVLAGTLVPSGALRFDPTRKY